MRAGWLHRRMRRGGHRRRLFRKEKGSGALRFMFRTLFGWHALRGESPPVCFVAADRRSGHWRGVGNFAELYR